MSASVLPVSGELHPIIPLPAARRGITGIKQYFLGIKPDISEEICIFLNMGRRSAGASFTVEQDADRIESGSNCNSLFLIIKNQLNDRDFNIRFINREAEVKVIFCCDITLAVMSVRFGYK